MINSVSPQTPKQTKIENAKNNAVGSILAMNATTVATAAAVPVQLLTMNAIASQSKNLPKKDIKTVNDAAQKVLNELTNLGKKGVEIVDFSRETKNPTKIPDFIYGEMDRNFSVSHGKNSFFAFKKCCNPTMEANTIVINKDKLSLMNFHELGHAYNHNNSAFWSFLQKSGCTGRKLAGVIALIPALTRDIKPEEGKELTPFQKFNNGLRKVSPFLAAGCFLPMVSEEVAASVRGCKWANQLLDKNLARKVLKNNIGGGFTYFMAMTCCGLGTFAAKKIKDRFVEKNENK